MRIREFFEDFDSGILCAVLLLLILGTIGVYSATRHIDPILFKKHILWIGIGIITAIIFYYIPYKFWSESSYIFYLLSLLLLILVLVFGAKVKGVKRWFDFGFFNLQPSEIAKFTSAMVLATIFSNRRKKFETIFSLIPPIVIIIIPFLLILIEPDFGSSIILLFILVIMFFLRGIKLDYILLLLTPVIAIIAGARWFTIVGLLAVLFLILYFRRFPLEEIITVLLVNAAFCVLNPIFWRGLKDYQKARIIGFLLPKHDPTGIGWQTLQSKIAIGSGGLFGKGFLSGTQKSLAFLPESHTDFIFGVFGEEFGFFISLFIILLFTLLIFQSIKIARTSRNNFASFLVWGIISIFSFAAFVNIGMTMGILPVVGVPLPFLSYGGTSMVISLAMVGLLLNIGKHKYEY